MPDDRPFTERDAIAIRNLAFLCGFAVGFLAGVLVGAMVAVLVCG